MAVQLAVLRLVAGLVEGSGGLAWDGAGDRRLQRMWWADSSARAGVLPCGFDPRSV